MAKKKSKVVQPKEEEVPADEAKDNEDQDDEEEDEGETEAEELELLQVDVGDMIKVKQILDETVAACLLEQENLQEDYQWDNIKLGIMTLACVFAMIAQFAPISFPESRYALGMCCLCYFILSGALQLITTFVDLDSILITKPLSSTSSPQQQQQDSGKTKKLSSSGKVKNQDLYQYGIRVRTQLPRFSEWYTVILELCITTNDKKKRNPKSSLPTPPAAAAAALRVEQKWSIGQFFDKEGMFDEIGLQLEVEKLYQRMVNGDYDKDVNAKKKD